MRLAPMAVLFTAFIHFVAHAADVLEYAPEEEAKLSHLGQLALAKGRSRPNTVGAWIVRPIEPKRDETSLTFITPQGERSTFEGKWEFGYWNGSCGSTCGYITVIPLASVRIRMLQLPLRKVREFTVQSIDHDAYVLFERASSLRADDMEEHHPGYKPDVPLPEPVQIPVPRSVNSSDAAHPAR